MTTVKEFAESLPDSVKKTGTVKGDFPSARMKAGKIDMIFSNGSIMNVSAGGFELVRMIYPAVRDRNWLTIDPVIENQQTEIYDDSFRVSFNCRYFNGEINFEAKYLFEGKSDNSFSLTMEGHALEKFEKNRIGFCVLHPVESCAGLNCIIYHIDGSTEESVFPEEISPEQVFRNIKAMKWMSGRVKCRLDFEGDIFETEDQRNWTDATYKTYSTPLSNPYPVILEKGTKVHQSVSFRIDGPVPESPELGDKTIVRLFPEEYLRVPPVGICQSNRTEPMTPGEMKVIRSLRFDHYRIDLYLYEFGWQYKAERGCQEASDLGYHLELALFFDDNVQQQLNNFKDWYFRRRLSVSAILLYHKSLPATPDSLARIVIPVLREKDPEIKIATGTNANFAQLNRNRPGETGNDSICYSIHPQEHSTTNQIIVENLAAQEYTIKSARVFSEHKGIIVSPVTLKRRFNANVSFTEIPDTGGEVPSQVDSRMMSLLGACWGTISLKYLCEGGADSVTIFETVGERGVFQGEYDSRWSDDFPAVKGMLFPVFHVLRFLLSNKDMRLIKSRSSKPLVIDSLALSDGKQARIILVNFTDRNQVLQLECCSGLFRIRTLSSESYSEAALNYRWSGIEKEKTIKSHTAFELKPYSINFIEGWRKH